MLADHADAATKIEQAFPGADVEPSDDVFEGHHVDHTILAQVLSENPLAELCMGLAIKSRLPEVVIMVVEATNSRLIEILGLRSALIG
jgi:hypothetical protein